MQGFTHCVWLVGFGRGCKQCSKFPRRTGSDDGLILVMSRCRFQGRRAWQGGSEESHGVIWNCLYGPGSVLCLSGFEAVALLCACVCKEHMHKSLSVA